MFLLRNQLVRLALHREQREASEANDFPSRESQRRTPPVSFSPRSFLLNSLASSQLARFWRDVGWELSVRLQAGSLEITPLPLPRTTSELRRFSRPRATRADSLLGAALTLSAACHPTERTSPLLTALPTLTRRILQRDRTAPPGARGEPRVVSSLARSAISSLARSAS